MTPGRQGGFSSQWHQVIELSARRSAMRRSGRRWDKVYIIYTTRFKKVYLLNNPSVNRFGRPWSSKSGRGQNQIRRIGGRSSRRKSGVDGLKCFSGWNDLCIAIWKRWLYKRWLQWLFILYTWHHEPAGFKTRSDGWIIKLREHGDENIR